MHVTEIAKIWGYLTSLRKEMAELLMLIGLGELNLLLDKKLKHDREFMGNMEKMHGRKEKILKQINIYKAQIEAAERGEYGEIDTTPLSDFHAQPLPVGGLN